MSVRAQMEALLGEPDVEAILLDEATPSLIKHCVRRVAKKFGGDTQRAFAICVASMQKGGYLEKGSMKLTAKGKAQSSQHAQEPDAEKKLKGYERLLKKAQKEGKSEKDLRGEALKMIAATEAAKKMKLKKKVKKEGAEECLPCLAEAKSCPKCKKSRLLYDDGCDCMKCEGCGWQGPNAPANEAKSERMSFESDGKQFEIRWSDKKHRFVVVVTDEDWDYDDEADAADMSAEIRLAKSLDDAAEILGVFESVEEGLDETFKVGTTRQRADGTYKKQTSGDWEKVMSGGSTPTSAAGVIQATFGKYGPGKLHKMSPEDKDHVVRALTAVAHQTLLRDSEQNAKLIQMMKGKKGHEDHIKDLEHMNKLYMKALAQKNKSESAGMSEMRRLSGIDKYPDRTLDGGPSKLMDQRQREAAGLAGAHADWTLGESLKLGDKERKNISLFLKRQGWGGGDFWFTDEISKAKGHVVKLNVGSDVAAEIADELNGLGEFGTAKVVDGSGKSEKQIVFGESKALWPQR